MHGLVWNTKTSMEAPENNLGIWGEGGGGAGGAGGAGRILKIVRTSRKILVTPL